MARASFQQCRAGCTPVGWRLRYQDGCTQGIRRVYTGCYTGCVHGFTAVYCRFTGVYRASAPFPHRFCTVSHPFCTVFSSFCTVSQIFYYFCRMVYYFYRMLYLYRQFYCFTHMLPHVSSYRTLPHVLFNIILSSRLYRGHRAGWEQALKRCKRCVNGVNVFLPDTAVTALSSLAV